MTILIILFFTIVGCNKPTEIVYYQKPVINKTISLFEYHSKVTATVYNAVPEQCNSNYLITASGFKLDSLNQYSHRILAVSRDLLSQFCYGDSVYIVGTGKYDGWWRIEDTMNKRWKKRIDLLINQDMGLGKWSDVRIYQKLK